MTTTLQYACCMNRFFYFFFFKKKQTTRTARKLTRFIPPHESGCCTSHLLPGAAAAGAALGSGHPSRRTRASGSQQVLQGLQRQHCWKLNQLLKAADRCGTQLRLHVCVLLSMVSGSKVTEEFRLEMTPGGLQPGLLLHAGPGGAGNSGTFPVRF